MSLMYANFRRKYVRHVHSLICCALLRHKYAYIRLGLLTKMCWSMSFYHCNNLSLYQREFVLLQQLEFVLLQQHDFTSLQQMRINDYKTMILQRRSTCSQSVPSLSFCAFGFLPLLFRDLLSVQRPGRLACCVLCSEAEKTKS